MNQFSNQIITNANFSFEKDSGEDCAFNEINKKPNVFLKLRNPYKKTENTSHFFGLNYLITDNINESQINNNKRTNTINFNNNENSLFNDKNKLNVSNKIFIFFSFFKFE